MQPPETHSSLPSPDDEGDEVEPLDPTSLSLRIDERGRLFAAREGKDDLQVVARRAFPWSNADAFISLRTTKGREVALLETLDAAPVDARPLILSALASATFIPRVTAVRRISLEHGFQSWDVVTESGEAKLRVQEREDVRFFGDARLGIKDANGNVYEIPNVATLDEHSQRELAKIM